MSVFTVDLANRLGELARLCEAMAGRGINLVLSAIAREDGGTVAFIADDEAGAQEVLDGAGLQYAMRPALTIRMENQPGTGAATFRKLASAGVNADLLLPVRVSDALFFAVICVDDQDKARQALGAQVIPPGPRPVALAAVSGGAGRARGGHRRCPAVVPGSGALIRMRGSPWLRARSWPGRVSAAAGAAWQMTRNPGGKTPATLRSPALPGRLGWPGCPRCRRSGGHWVMTGAIAGARTLAPDPRNAIN